MLRPVRLILLLPQFLASADTVAVPIATFFGLMVMYPEVQAKIHEELDRVLGPNQLPTFRDADRLPYCMAVIKETIR